MPERSKSEVGKLFAHRRNVTLTWSQRQTAERAGMGLASVQNAEYGKEEVTPRTYAKLAKALGWPANAYERLRAGEDPDDLPSNDPDRGVAHDTEIIAGLTPEQIEQVRGYADALRQATEPGATETPAARPAPEPDE